MESRFALVMTVAALATLTSVAGCATRRSSPPADGGHVGVDGSTGVDGSAGRDGSTGTDAGGLPDTGLPAACAGGPLSAPLPDCELTVPPSTGDPAQDCVNRINQFRAQCQCLPPLARWTDGEACANQDAMYDAMQMSAHAGAIGSICPWGNGENECPGWDGWSSIPMTIDMCLQGMWDEGPGPFYGPPEHGHYLNMSSTTFTRVACGFYSGAGGVTATQNFE